MTAEPKGREHTFFAAYYERRSQSAEREWLGRRRAGLVGDLAGEVLEIGAGTGANLPHYRSAQRVVATEPDAAMRRRLQTRLQARTPRETAAMPVTLGEASAESLPYADGSFDAVVCTLVLCSVDDQHHVLAEIRRVLRPAGRLAVLEHVRGDGRLARWQDRLTPLWTRFAAGCHLNRDTQAAIERAGFSLERVERFAVAPRWVPTSPMLEAVARPNQRTVRT